jgi:hypothetical protein
MIRPFQLKSLAVFLAFAWVAAAPAYGHSESVTPSTAIPVVFSRPVEAGKATSGATVTAKTSQLVLLPDGKALPIGTILRGHVVQSVPFVPNAAPYAVQKPSILSIHFDTIEVGGAAVPVHLSVRALAGPVLSYQASIPHYRDETDTTGTRLLIGGSSFSPLQKAVWSPNGKIVAYHRTQGVYARLLPGDTLDSEGAANHCEATETEQAVGIFSPSACGVYGVNTVAIADNGRARGGTFVLKSEARSVALFAGTTALLQVMAP